MEKNFGLLFYLKKPKNFKNGQRPVYLRITVNGISSEICTKRKCDYSDWNNTAGRMDGKTEFAKSLNSYPDVLQRKVYEARKKLAENDQMAALVNIEYAPGTLERYTTSFNHTRSFLEWKYQVSDMDIAKLNYEFITEYEFWLKSVRKCDHNTTMKYLSNFRKIVKRCLLNGWLQKDPFMGFKMPKREVESTALTELEIEKMANMAISIERLKPVRDIYSCSVVIQVWHMQT
jgi:hypothetical protein